MKAIFIITLIIRWLITPFIFSISFLFPGLRKRYLLEKNQNLTWPKQVDYLFEVSSEGELEQVLPLVKELLARKLTVQLVYCSESVKTKVERLQSEHHGLHIMLLPLLTNPFLFLKWAKGESFIMVRYDFFPELILYGMKSGVKFTLLLATLKGKKRISFIKRLIYQSFDQIIPSSELDRKRFLAEGLTHIGPAFDYRILQISNRIEGKEQTFFNDKDLQNVVDFVHSHRGMKIILGSFWPVELDLLNNPQLINSVNSGDILLYIAPHKLDGETMSFIQVELEKRGYKVQREHEQLQKGAIILSGLKGVLCEIYSLFDISYVGGGFGRSIHSVLEPFLAHTKVICGPKTFRSTEYDLIMEEDPDVIIRIEQFDQFYPAVRKLENTVFHIEKLEQFVANYQVRKKEIQL